MISTQATTGDESTMMASNEEIADDAALAGQADAFSIGAVSYTHLTLPTILLV